MSNEWTTSTQKSGNGGGEYDPEGFYIDATDGRGHSEEIRVKVSPNFYARLGVIVASKKFPYRSVADMARNGLVHIVVRDEQHMEDEEVGVEVKLVIRKNQAMAEARRFRDEEELIKAREDTAQSSTIEERWALAERMKHDLEVISYSKNRMRLEDLIKSMEKR